MTDKKLRHNVLRSLRRIFKMSFISLWHADCFNRMASLLHLWRILLHTIVTPIEKCA